MVVFDPLLTGHVIRCDSFLVLPFPCHFASFHFLPSFSSCFPSPSLSSISSLFCLPLLSRITQGVLEKRREMGVIVVVVVVVVVVDHVNTQLRCEVLFRV